jgi:hypothetical protein
VCLSPAHHTSYTVAPFAAHVHLKSSKMVQFHRVMSVLLNSASTLAICSSRVVHSHFFQSPSLLGKFGTLLPQRLPKRATLSLWHPSSRRQQLLCCSCSLSALAIRLAVAVDHRGICRIEHQVVAHIWRRYLSLIFWKPLVAPPPRARRES